MNRAAGVSLLATMAALLAVLLIGVAMALGWLQSESKKLVWTVAAALLVLALGLIFRAGMLSR